MLTSFGNFNSASFSGIFHSFAYYLSSHKFNSLKSIRDDFSCHQEEKEEEGKLWKTFSENCPELRNFLPAQTKLNYKTLRRRKEITFFWMRIKLCIEMKKPTTSTSTSISTLVFATVLVTHTFFICNIYTVSLFVNLIIRSITNTATTQLYIKASKHSPDGSDKNHFCYQQFLWFLSKCELKL